MATVQIFQSLRFGELVVNSNSPILRVVKLWIVSPNSLCPECCLFHMYSGNLRWLDWLT